MQGCMTCLCFWSFCPHWNINMDLHHRHYGYLVLISSSSLMLCLHNPGVTNFNALDSHCVFVIPRESQWNMRAAIVDGVYVAWLGSRMWHSPLTTAAGKLRSLHFQVETQAARLKSPLEKERRGDIWSSTVNQARTLPSHTAVLQNSPKNKP